MLPAQKESGNVTNRDTYFFDLCREAGLNPSDPHDWINIGFLMEDAKHAGLDVED